MRTAKTTTTTRLLEKVCCPRPNNSSGCPATTGLVLLLMVAAAILSSGEAVARQPIEMVRKFDLDFGGPLGQFRSAPVELGDGAPRGFVAVYSEEGNIDPHHPNIRWPKDNLKLAVFDEIGKVHWRRELGRAVVPGTWYVPVLPFDLDGDGTDEIWFVNNTSPDRPFAPNGYRLERLDARTGETTGQWPWPRPEQNQMVGRLFRNFIIGGYAHGKPVLITAQGTYGPMALQAWNSDLTSRWQYKIGATDPGARGSHMTPVIDLDHDGVDEILWGERVIRVDTGEEVVCADRDVWAGHSDTILPLHDRTANRYSIFTTREKDPAVAPRVVLYDDAGNRKWGDVEFGHIHRGWLARIGPDHTPVAMAMRVGEHHRPLDTFYYEAFTGRRVSMGDDLQRATPVDLTGDGAHEFVFSRGDGVEIVSRHDYDIVNLPGTVVMVAKLLDFPGEHVLTYTKDGRISIWVDANAVDGEVARARYAHPYYRLNRKFTAVGYNRVLLSGM